MAGITPYREAAADPSTLPATRRDADSPYKLLLKPNGQQALVKGLSAVQRVPTSTPRSDEPTRSTGRIRKSGRTSSSSPTAA